MRRREFITLLCGAASAWPLPAKAQQRPAIPVIGYLEAGSPEPTASWVTAFRKGMAVHGRHGLPCPRCGAKIQRIRFASNETNYCPRCQTGGKVLADRSLSRLLREDWPRTLEELEERRR